MVAGSILEMDESRRKELLKKCKKGMVRSVTLPDGSVATVSQGSVLRYPETFNDEERKMSSV